jgi:hypothetical protein
VFPWWWYGAIIVLLLLLAFTLASFAFGLAPGTHGLPWR